VFQPDDELLQFLQQCVRFTVLISALELMAVVVVFVLASR